MADDTKPTSQKTTTGHRVAQVRRDGLTVKVSQGPSPDVGAGKILRQTVVVKNPPPSPPPQTGKKPE